MRGHRFLTEPDAFSKDQTKDESRPSGGHMNDCASSEIDRVNAGVFIEDAIHKTVDAPDHVRLREIDNEHPQDHEQANRGKFHPFCDRANYQGGRDDGEHQLVH